MQAIQRPLEQSFPSSITVLTELRELLEEPNQEERDLVICELNENVIRLIANRRGYGGARLLTQANPRAR